MKKENHNEIFEEGELVFCIDESNYIQHLTKRKQYEVAEVGTGTKLGKLRVGGDSNRLVWISDLCFSSVNQPLIKR